jgi:hypothetical protein
VPAFWTLGAINTLLVWRLPDIWEARFPLVFVPLFLIYIFWLCVPLKKVSVANNTLYVSNYRKEIAVPLSEIADVRGNRFTEPQRVTIYLRQPSEFGSKIVFMAKHRIFSFYSVHPVVDELKAMAGIN